VIVIISHEQDPHAARVMQQLAARGERVLLLNLSELPARATLSIDYARCGRPCIEYVRADASYPLHQARSVWWRRPQAPDLSSITDPQVNLFTANEWSEAINGLWQLIPGRWMNDPVRDDAASRKARQLSLAAEVGLKVPRTLITSDPERARAFVAAANGGGTIYKTFSCTHAIWRETRLFRPDDMAHLESVRLAPVIFQEFVPAESDIRVTAVGDRLFAAGIRTVAGGGLVDFRMSVAQAEMGVVKLPAGLADRLTTLLGRLGLAYGAIDLRRTPDGEYYFFEVNTAGEFLFVEDRTGLPISSAIADWLAAT
jgi:glutathione synthase/RimK-type ligase-like ATP-grasp enzyme